MKNAKQQLLGWSVMAFVVSLLACAGGLVMLKVLPPVDSARIMSKLPGPIRQVADAILFPHPDLVPTPITRPSINVASLLTPIPTSTPRPTSTPTATPIDAPTEAPTIQPTDTPVPIEIPTIHAPGLTQAARSTPASAQGVDVLLKGAQQVYQTWNNCGPATLTMNLSFFGWGGTQAEAAKFLKPDSEDKNVSPDELVAYARSVGFQAVHRANGTTDLIKSLLRAGLPVLIEKGFEPEAELGWMGHYELIVGFNNVKQEFIAMDSYMGPYQSVPYDQFDTYWRQFNRTYLVVYTDAQADTATSILGNQLDDATMWNQALAGAQAEAANNPNDAYAWFDLGTDYAALNQMENAAAAYDHARGLGLPWRMTWYQFGWFDAYYQTGRYDDVLALVDATLKVTPNVEEMYYYKGLVLKARGDSDGARSQFQIALQRNPNFGPAQAALAALAQ